MKKRFLSMMLIAALAMSVLSGCAAGSTPAETTVTETTRATQAAAEPVETTAPTAPAATEAPASEKNGDIMILYTSDVHCGIDQNFGYAGVEQVRFGLEAQGYTTILVDNGDAIQGDVIGTVTAGEGIIQLMNDTGYDVAIPGNHEFDYTTENFLKLVEKANFPYISCNFRKEGELVLAPYIILEAAGKKIAFVGVTTPKAITSSTPKYFQNEQGEFIYDFCQDKTGEALYNAVQEAVNGARAEGADYVLVMAHVGNEEDCAPWTYADIISNTEGIDVFMDGHSHDTEQVVMKNKNGEDVIRTACGTKMQAVGWVKIPADGAIQADLYTWNNDISVPDLFALSNNAANGVAAAKSMLDSTLSEVVASSEVDLTIYDPEAKDDKGAPIRIVRRMETNLGDLCADAYRDQMGTDIALCNGGGVRTSLSAGDITMGGILKVHPFNNEMYVVSATGQQIIDALEWGAAATPKEAGKFLHVSGLTYEIHTYIESSCTSDENGMFTGVSGEYRVKNVCVGGEPIDPNATYTVGGTAYMLLNSGDGYTVFNGCEGRFAGMLDNQALINYIRNTLGGTIGEAYADPYGEGRIVIVEAPAA